MTQDEIIRMAREAGFQASDLDTMFWQVMERFAALVAAHEREKQAEQIPVGYIYNDITHDRMPVYAAPVRTKDLTDDEERQVITATVEGVTTSELVMFKAVARAVIAKYKEKNK